MPKMTALLDGGGAVPSLGGPCHVLEGSYSGGGGAYRKVEGVHFAKWRGSQSSGGVF